jgi:hypothetical protein
MRKSLIIAALLGIALPATADEWNADAYRSQVIDRIQACGSVSPYDVAGLRFCDHIERLRNSGVNVLLMSNEALCYNIEGVAPGGCAEQIDSDKRARRAAARYPAPIEIDLCPAPRKLTRDGCK